MRKRSKTAYKARVTVATSENRIEATDENKIELGQEELSDVSGGVITHRKRGENPVEY